MGNPYQFEDLRIELEHNDYHYVYEMHEKSGERLRKYIIEHPEDDFITAVMMCGEMVNVYAIKKNEPCPVCKKSNQNGELCEECMIEQTQFAIDNVDFGG